jgi:hypothetical protein
LRDEFACRVLNNLQDRVTARAEMKMDAKSVRAVRRLVRRAGGGQQGAESDVSVFVRVLR